MVAAETGLLIRTLLYAVTISAFGAMALSIAMDPRTALESMASFLIAFVLLRLLELPISLTAVLPLAIAGAVFVYRLRSTGRSHGRLFGRGIGRLMLGLLSAASLAVGLFILVTVVTRIGITAIVAEYGTARTTAIMVLEAGPLLVGALGFMLLYRANEAGPAERPGRRQEELMDTIGQEAIPGDGADPGDDAEGSDAPADDGPQDDTDTQE